MNILLKLLSLLRRKRKKTKNKKRKQPNRKNQNLNPKVIFTMRTSSTLLVSVEELIEKAKSSNTLFLKKLPITKIPDEVFQLTNLQVLVLSGLKLEKVPADIGKEIRNSCIKIFKVN